MNKTIDTILALLLLSSHLFSQGSYVERGENAVGIIGTFSHNEDLSGFAGGFGYSASGIFDFGLSVRRVSFEQKIPGYDLAATAISPFIVVYPIKQDSLTPVSVSLSGSYQSDMYSFHTSQGLNGSMSGSEFIFGGSIYVNAMLSPTTKLQPSVSVSYSMGKSEIQDSHGNSFTIDNNMAFYNLAVALFFQTGSSTILGIKPGATVTSHNTTIVVGAVFVYVLGK
jgi:hypothetical protein